MKDRLQLSDSVSELLVFGAERLQLILQLSLLLLGETQSLKLLLLLQAMLGLLLKWSEEENAQGDGADFSGKRGRGMEFGTTSFNSNLAWLFHAASTTVSTCRSCSTASSNCWILPCRVSISSLLAVIFSCMSMAVWRPEAKARPQCKETVKTSTKHILDRCSPAPCQV